MLELNEKSLELISTLADSLHSVGMRQRKDLQYQISCEKKKIDERAAYVDGVLKKNGFSDINALRAASQLQAQEQEAIKVNEKLLSGHEKNVSDAVAEYQELEKSVPLLYKSMIDMERIAFREAQEADCQKMIKTEFGKQFSPSDYKLAILEIDNIVLAKKSHTKKLSKKRDKLKYNGCMKKSVKV